MNSRTSDVAPTPRDQRQFARRPWTEAAGEGPEEVGDERGSGEGRQPEGLEAAAPGDRRQERTDQRHRHAHTDGRDEIEREVAPDRPLGRRWME